MERNGATLPLRYNYVCKTQASTVTYLFREFHRQYLRLVGTPLAHRFKNPTIKPKLSHQKAYKGHGGKIRAGEPRRHSRRDGEHKNLSRAVQSEGSHPTHKATRSLHLINVPEAVKSKPLCQITKFTLASIIITSWCSN
jgi:hypothetical protein